jgi:hypothetical protein
VSETLTIILIIVINISITLMNIYLAIKIWQLRQILSKITLFLINCENYLQILFYLAPQAIYQGQDKIANFRQTYQLLQLRWQQTKQIILLVNWSYRAWRGIS